MLRYTYNLHQQLSMQMANRNSAVIGEDDGDGVDGGLVQNVLVAHVPVLIIVGQPYRRR